MSKVRCRIDDALCHVEYTRARDEQDKARDSSLCPTPDRIRGFALPLDDAEIWLSESLTAVRLAQAEKAARRQ